jgi:hypothetical protein
MPPRGTESEADEHPRPPYVVMPAPTRLAGDHAGGEQGNDEE